jgi:hypothetical protein
LPESPPPGLEENSATFFPARTFALRFRNAVACRFQNVMITELPTTIRSNAFTSMPFDLRASATVTANPCSLNTFPISSAISFVAPPLEP